MSAARLFAMLAHARLIHGLDVRSSGSDAEGPRNSSRLQAGYEEPQAPGIDRVFIDTVKWRHLKEIPPEAIPFAPPVPHGPG